MAQTLKLEHIVNTNPENAISFFSDFAKFAALHPLFIRLKKIDDTHFVIREKMPVTNIKFNYKATVINKKENNEIIYVAYPMFQTLTISFVFNPGTKENTCHISETITIKGIFPAPMILKNLISKVHPQLITNLNKQF